MGAPEGFARDDLLFSLCGLNCGLCPMFVRGDCAGCRTDSWCARFCKIAPCSVRHGNVDYRFERPEYPCPHYDGNDKHDSLMSHRNQRVDMAKAARVGIEVYHDEQRAKAAVLRRLLDDFDDETHDVFFCLAVNMLAPDDLRFAIERAQAGATELNAADRARRAEAELRRIAAGRDIPLEPRRLDGLW